MDDSTLMTILSKMSMDRNAEIATTSLNLAAGIVAAYASREKESGRIVISTEEAIDVVRLFDLTHTFEGSDLIITWKPREEKADDTGETKTY